MINSIQHFQQKVVANLCKTYEKYAKDTSKMAEMIYSVTKEVTN